jgi:hypothetical protein
MEARAALTQAIGAVRSVVIAAAAPRARQHFSCKKD